MLHLYVGHDEKEQEALTVLTKSLEPYPDVAVTPVVQKDLIDAGLYTRTWHRDHTGQRIDDHDGRPFSTDFTFTRFLIPWIHRIPNSRWVLFCDSDFMFRANPNLILDHADPRYAVQVVKHDHRPTEATKMSGQAQTSYPRKNWSSLILWNLAHGSHNRLKLSDVNVKPGSWLHGFGWLEDDEIGDLPEEWNHLYGVSSEMSEPKAVHFTKGVPTHKDVPESRYTREWWSYLRNEANPPVQGKV